jgi:UDPglucose--hexose-1-phosphate uridylyltransferase
METSSLAAWEQRWHPLREDGWSSPPIVRIVHGKGTGRHVGHAAARIRRELLFRRNLRVSGARNPDYQSVFVFDNDHPCVGSDAPRQLEPPPGIYRNAPATGVARVVCYTPKHNTTLAELPVDQIAALLDAWRDQY